MSDAAAPAQDAPKQEEDSRKVNLVSMDGDSFEVSRSVAAMSELVKTLISDDADDDEVQEIPLPNVKSPVLSKVIEFCSHHHNSPMREIEKVGSMAGCIREPLKSADMHDVVSDWDANFVDIEQEILFELILAANYMDIKSLLDLACAKVASMIKGKTPQEIRETFNIVNDFTPEEEAQIREENKWCEEA
ncbi:suppressor of kinetochore protein mutant [Phytophthora pseudosyringae]|uniref:Suppressor of kinetochore protein mutant n=1 Tax=Phytophthora pseudosyringae TaxID=221518 RepID=A0A8T1WCM2_9STRA|nr:suppressor of kinetochore protein mutant [Phytophthora pseudosyringae]